MRRECHDQFALTSFDSAGKDRRYWCAIPRPVAVDQPSSNLKMPVIDGSYNHVVLDWIYFTTTKIIHYSKAAGGPDQRLTIRVIGARRNV
jgi:hypothetical protein